MNEFKKKLLETTDGHCSYCGKNIRNELWDMDHMVARAKGGDQKGNLAPACMRCNLRKGCLSVEEFREWLTKKGGKVLLDILPDIEELCQFLPDDDAERVLENFTNILNCLAETQAIFYIDSH